MISAVIVNYRTPGPLRRCLRSLEGWNDVVVVDNCSGDESVEMVKRDFERVTLLSAEENRGFGAGANLGLAAASGQYALVLNPDNWVGPETLPALERSFACHPGAGIVGCGLFDPDGLPLISARRYYSPSVVALRRIAPVSRPVRHFELLDRDFTSARRVDWVAGSGMAVKISAFEEVGGFDDRFFLYFEDVDLCLRMWLAGFEVWHDRSAPVFHVESRASTRSARPLLWHLGSWLKFQRKWARLHRPNFTDGEILGQKPAPDHAVDTMGRTPLRPRQHAPDAIRVAIEASMLLDSPTGVGRSLESLIKAFGERDDIDPLLVAVSLRRTGGVHRYRTLARTRAVRLPARPMQTIWSRFGMPPAELFTGNVHVVHGPNFFVPPTLRAATVVTVHDIGFVRYPEFHTPVQRELADVLPESLKRADRIITVSEFTRDEVADWSGIDRDRIDVVPHGVRRLPTEGPRPEGLPDEYLLYAGTLESRKGAEILLDGYRRAVNVEPGLPPLVIAGSTGLGGQEAIDKFGLDHPQLIRLGRVDDSELGRLFADASAFVFPSLYEGFGMPPLEAMAEGTPVVASNVSSLPEVLGDAALLIEPEPEALAETIIRIMRDDELRGELVSRGLARIRKFTWASSAAQAVSSYKRAIEARS